MKVSHLMFSGNFIKGHATIYMQQLLIYCGVFSALHMSFVMILPFTDVCPPIGQDKPG